MNDVSGAEITTLGGPEYTPTSASVGLDRASSITIRIRFAITAGNRTIRRLPTVVPFATVVQPSTVRHCTLNLTDPLAERDELPKDHVIDRARLRELDLDGRGIGAIFRRPIRG